MKISGSGEQAAPRTRGVASLARLVYATMASSAGKAMDASLVGRSGASASSSGAATWNDAAALAAASTEKTNTSRGKRCSAVTVPSAFIDSRWARWVSSRVCSGTTRTTSLSKKRVPRTAPVSAATYASWDVALGNTLSTATSSGCPSAAATRVAVRLRRAAGPASAVAHAASPLSSAVPVSRSPASDTAYADPTTRRPAAAAATRAEPSTTRSIRVSFLLLSGVVPVSGCGGSTGSGRPSQAGAAVSVDRHGSLRLLRSGERRGARRYSSLDAPPPSAPLGAEPRV